MSAGASFRRPRSGWAGLTRTSCSECGGTITWMDVHELAKRVSGPDAERVAELREFGGKRADAWHCDVCSGWGVFQSEMVWT